MSNYQPDLILYPNDEITFYYPELCTYERFTVIGQEKDKYILKDSRDIEIHWHIDYLSEKINRNRFEVNRNG